MKSKQHYQPYLWIDEFVKNIRSYVFVRLEDHLLIKRPNQATKLNPSGAKILHFLLSGGNIIQILHQTAPYQHQDIDHFMKGVKDYLENKLDVFNCNPAVTKQVHQLGFSEWPVLSEIALTYACNLRCKFCYAGCNCISQQAQTSGPKLSQADFKKIIDKIYLEAKVPSVSFTGGEPTLVKFLPQLVAHAKNYHMRVNLITNGTLMTEQLAADLKSAGLDSAQVSIEGTSPVTHDQLVGQEGAFEKALEGISWLKGQHIHTHTNTTLTRYNLAEAVSFPEFVKKMLALDRFSMNMVIPSGTIHINKNLLLKYEEMGTVLEQLIQESKKQEVEFMWYSPLPVCLYNTITAGLGNKGCGACDGLLSVSPGGDILPCSSFTKSVGNLLEQSFTQIWQSPESKAIRNKALAPVRCQTCADLAVCHGACPLYWQNVGTEVLENQKLNATQC
ncbi:MAG: radical SAM protein [Candidatus Cyclobacteriaceae bacterium M3_2C_046]